MKPWMIVCSLSATVAAVLVFAPVAVQAVSDTPPARTTSEPQTHSDRIRENCSSALVSLRRLHQSDALLRINRGQLYEYMATKLMARLNSRIALNRLDGAALVTATARYERALVDFRQDYREYEMKLSAALRIDCQARPMDFYNGVAEARSARQDVARQIDRINESIDEYAHEFNEFRKRVESTNATSTVEEDAL